MLDSEFSAYSQVGFTASLNDEAGALRPGQIKPCSFASGLAGCTENRNIMG